MNPNRKMQQLVKSRIVSFIEESKALSLVDHPALKGKMREHGIGKFLKGFLPSYYDIGSGEITDSIGYTSNETDIIIYNNSRLPPYLFSDQTGIFPVESCEYAIEVKSCLTAVELRSSISKAKNIRNLRPLRINFPKPNQIPVPILFAYSSDLKSNPIEEFERYKREDLNYLTDPAIRALCVVGRGYWTYNQNSQTADKWLYFKADEEHYEVLSLLGGIMNTLLMPFGPNFGYYILEDETHTEKAISV